MFYLTIFRCIALSLTHKCYPPRSQLIRSERWEFIKENKKVRKQELDQESDQENKKTRTRPRKLPKKEKILLFWALMTSHSAGVSE